MRALILIFAAVIFCSSFSIDDNTCLEIKGFVLDAKDKKLDKVKVTVMENGKEISSIDTKCPFKLNFPRDHYYSLIITSPGYIPAVIMIDTSVPKSNSDCGFHFEFRYNMILESNKYNQEYVDFPAAIVKYTKSGEEFIISDKYNKYIKKMIGENQ